jgi:Asp/Glu/hydantoin racemase
MGGFEGKTVYTLYTTLGGLIDILRAQMLEALPGVRVVSVADDSLLADVRAAGGLTKAVTQRMVSYAMAAQAAGADAFFNTCSSVGEAADVIRQVVDIPVIKIDEAMAAEVVDLGERIGVIATLPTTLAPTARLVARQAEAAGKKVKIGRYLVEGAFDVLVGGDPETHNRMILDEIQRAAGEVDVIALAQGSMSRLLPHLPPELGVPVLGSPSRGIADLARVLRG